MSIITQRLAESIAVKQQMVDDTKLQEIIENAIQMILKSLKNGGTIYFCGNGGSAADAQHLAAELSGRFYFDRQPLSADALHCNTSFLTAVANDYSFDEVYARLMTGIARKGDVLVGLSTSGNSKNIVKAFQKAKQMEVSTISFTGQTGGEMKNWADVSICIPSTDTPRIQESHITVGHIICEMVESDLFGKK